MKAPNWLGDIALLLSRLTYLPLPKKWRSDPSRLPRAMRFLPLLGAASGSIVCGCMRLFVVMPLTGAAAVLIGVELLTGGAFLLRDLMRTADGRGGSISDAAQDMLNDEPILDNDTELSVKQRRFDVGRAGLVWGLVRTLALYLIYLYLLRHPAYGQAAVIAAAVSARLLMCWTIYHYPAFPPATLHRGVSGRDFGVSCLLALILLCPLFPVNAASLLAGFLVALMGVYLFASYRIRFHIALDEPCYGAAGAWAELLFLLAWLAVVRWL